ncbi:MAG: metal ABC transporter permease [Candidatus Harrisonbacteria bacterium]|nr:metal ABC transporter permease [Candidatus Harrisonbacteria bacterium]
MNIMENILTNQTLFISLVVGLFVGAASGYLGSVMVLKRLALVGDALSHVALPGIGIALLLEINPFVGAFAALFIGTLLVWGIERITTVPVEAIVGIIFSVSLAVGLLVTPEPELLEALFGDISAVSPIDGILAVALSVLVVAAMMAIKRKMLLGIVSEDFAKAQNIKIGVLNLLFLILVAIVVALGVKVVVTLLMGSLVIIPAAASKNIARSFSTYGILSLILGAISAVGGILAAGWLNFAPGPLVVLASAAIFLATFAFRSGRA